MGASGIDFRIHQRIFISPTDYQETIFKEYPESFRVDFKESLIKRNKDSIPFNNICYTSVGIVGNSNEKHFKGEFEVSDLLSEVKDEIHQKLYF